jgi:hypothetical protein
MGEDYQSSADEAPVKLPVAEEAPADGGDGEVEGDSLGAKVADFKRKLKQYELDNAFSDDEIAELDIKTKISNYHRSEGKEGEKIHQELLSEAFRWRLS